MLTARRPSRVAMDGGTPEVTVTTWALTLVGGVMPMRALRGRFVGKLAREFQIWRWRRVRRPERLGPRARQIR